MCVILVSPGASARPSRSILEACHEANPHGAGLAWREKRGPRSKPKVRWLKNLDVDDAEALLAELPGEVVIHFRWASVGGVDPDLCHPFPVTATARPDLAGEAEAVLFHNGTWSGYEDALALLRGEHGMRIPRGPMSDTRAAALCVHRLGPRVLPRLPGKWVWMGAAKTRLHGSWSDFEGMKASNLWFLPRRPQPAPGSRQPGLWDWPEHESRTSDRGSRIACEPPHEPDANGDPIGATPRGAATTFPES